MRATGPSTPDSATMDAPAPRTPAIRGTCRRHNHGRPSPPHARHPCAFFFRIGILHKLFDRHLTMAFSTPSWTLQSSGTSTVDAAAAAAPTPSIPNFLPEVESSLVDDAVTHDMVGTFTPQQHTSTKRRLRSGQIMAKRNTKKIRTPLIEELPAESIRMPSLDIL